MLEIGETTRGSEGERYCRGCGEWRAVEDFAFKDQAAGRRHSQCRIRCRERSKRHYEANRHAYLARNRRNNPLQRGRAASYVQAFLLEHPCVTCGEADPVVLEFNHRDPRSKLRNISDLIRAGASTGVLNREMGKCEVLCANCHQRLTTLSRACHYKRRPSSSSLAPSTVKFFRVAANARNHHVVLEYLKSVACADCGVDDPLVLQFDHLGAKTRDVAWLVGSGCSPERLKRELARCEMRCANCHRRKTAAQGSWFRTRRAATARAATEL